MGLRTHEEFFTSGTAGRTGGLNDQWSLDAAGGAAGAGGWAGVVPRRASSNAATSATGYHRPGEDLIIHIPLAVKPFCVAAPRQRSNPDAGNGIM